MTLLFETDFDYAGIPGYLHVVGSADSWDYNEGGMDAETGAYAESHSASVSYGVCEDLPYTTAAQYVEITVESTGSSSDGLGSCTRFQSVSSGAKPYCYEFLYGWGSYYFYRRNGNLAPTNLGTGSHSHPSADDVLLLSSDGNTHTSKFNGSTVDTASDSENPTGCPGFTSRTTAASVKDFTVTDDGTAGGSGSPMYAYMRQQ